MDDEPQVLWLLRNILSEHGYTLLGTGNPDEVMRLMETEQPELVLLDLMLPGTSGFELMRRIREVSDLAGHLPVRERPGGERGEGSLNGGRRLHGKAVLVDRAAGESRIIPAERRSGGTAMPRQPYRLGDLAINYADRSVTVSGRTVGLSATEYKLLSELSISAGRVLTRNHILHRVWGEEYSGQSGLLRATVRNLRRKLEDDANDPRYIFTEPRVGYHMAKAE